MLHSSDPPAQLQQAEQSVSLPEGVRDERRKTERVSIWKWISLRELVFIFAACSVGAALFQPRDDVKYIRVNILSASRDAISVLPGLSRPGEETWTRLHITTRNTHRKMRDCE